MALVDQVSKADSVRSSSGVVFQTAYDATKFAIEEYAFDHLLLLYQVLGEEDFTCFTSFEEYKNLEETKILALERIVVVESPNFVYMISRPFFFSAE
jgi:hypothetical protein